MKIDPSLMNIGVNLSSEQKLRRQDAAAEDFEAMFLQMMLKEMHPKSTDGLLNAGQAEQMFYQFMDEAIAKDMVRTNQSGLGLAQAMKNQYLK
ncbi:MAG: rod-binding protein [Candidatus Caenarcaniphilales bacterium]|nr:rod-binding protein [Candidatus Caenarcaniphilales bacterium]